MILIFDICCAEFGMFWYNQVSAMAADALAPCVTRTSTAIVFTINDWETGAQCPPESILNTYAISSVENYRKWKYAFLFLKINSAWQGLIL